MSRAMRAGSRVLVAVLLPAVLAAGCASIRRDLVRRASFDLDCPQQKLEIHELGGTLTSPHGVSGCGRRATYLYDPASGRWVMNSPRIEQVGAPVSPAAQPTETPLDGGRAPVGEPGASPANHAI